MEHKKNGDKDETKEALESLRHFSFSNFGFRTLLFGIRLLKNIVFTRLLGPADRGIFSLLMTIPDLIVGFGNLGFGLGNTYLLAKQKYDLKKIVGNTLLVTVLLGLVLAAIGYAVFSYKGLLKGDSETVRAFAPIVLLLIPLVLLQRFGEDILIAIKKIHFLNFMGVCFSTIPVVLIFPLLLFTDAPLKAAVYAWAASIVVVAFWSILNILSKSSYRVALSYSYFKESFSYGSRGYLSIVADIMVRRIDVMLVSYMLGANSLGLYAVSVSVAEILLSLSTAISQPFLPIRLGLEIKDAEIVTPIVIRHVLFIMSLICLGILVGGKLVILLMFGKAFLPAYSSVLWLLPGILALSIYSFLKSEMYSYNLPGFVSWSSVASLFSNLFLNFLLIPRLGINGAAISSSFAYGLATIILLIKFRRLSNFSYSKLLLIKKSEIRRMLGKLKFSQS